MANLNLHDIVLLDAPEFKGFQEKIEGEYDLEILSTSLPNIISFTSKKLILHTSKGSFFLKEKPQYCSSELALKRSAHFQDYVSSQLKIVPEVLHTKAGYHYITWRRKYYFLTHYKVGRHYNGSKKDLDEMIKALHMFQQCGITYLKECKKSRVEELSHFESLDVAIGIPDVENKIKSRSDNVAFQEILSLYENLCAEYSDLAKGEYIMAHGDFILFNLILNKSKVVAINDFDNVKVLPRIHDMAEFLVSASLLNYIAPLTNLKLPVQTRPEDLALTLILDSYLSKFHLSDTEIKLLGVVVEIVWLWTLVLAVFKDDYTLSDLKPALEALGQREIKNRVDHFCVNYF